MVWLIATLVVLIVPLALYLGEVCIVRPRRRRRARERPATLEGAGSHIRVRQ